MATNGSKDVAGAARDTVRQVEDRVAEGLDELRSYADSADAALREFARERPMVAIACAVGLGFLLGRLASRI